MTRPVAQHRRSALAGWRLSWLSLATAVLFVIGSTVLLAPTIANWFSQLDQAQRITDLSDEVRDYGAVSLARALDDARAYNDALTGGALLGENERIPQASAAPVLTDYSYDELLKADAHGLMARVKIPVIGADLPIYHGTSDATLAEGVGHLEGTALPVGGPGTRSVLTAHRGLATSELFTHLDLVAVGDTFTIEVFGEVLSYRVISTEVVEPSDSRALLPQPGRDLVTLVTCTPLGINSHRILVTGERILPTPVAEMASAGKPPTIPGFPWWILALAGVLVAATLYIVTSGRVRRRERWTPRARDRDPNLTE